MADSGRTDAPSPPRVGDENQMPGGSALLELVRAHRRPNNGVHLSLEGVEYLATGDVRIGEDTPRDASQAPESAYTPLTGARAYTRTVNLEVAHNRLQDILADDDDEHAARVQRTYHEPALDDGFDEETAREEEQVYLERESRSVEWLTKHGLPLLYDPRRIGAVRADPRRFQGLLRAFWEHPPMLHDAPYICFFERQALRWQEFTRFQLHCRGMSEAVLGDEVLRTAYLAMIVREADSGREWKQLLANPWRAHTEQRWDEFRAEREDEARYMRDRGAATFADYQAATLTRLATGCALDDVTPDLAPPRDLRLASRRVRWAEYLAFECWYAEHTRRDVELLRPAHDAAYEALREAVALRDHETPDFLPTEDAALERRLELDMARGRSDGLKLTRARLLLQRSSSEGARRPLGDLTETESETRQRPPAAGAGAAANDEATRRLLDECEAALAEAERDEARAQRRSDAVDEFLVQTEHFRDALDVREAQVGLVAWARDKYHEIRDEELAEAEGTLPSPHVSFRLHEDGDEDAQAEQAEQAGDDDVAAAAAAQPSTPPPPLNDEACPSDTESGPPSPCVLVASAQKQAASASSAPAAVAAASSPSSPVVTRSKSRAGPLAAASAASAAASSSTRPPPRRSARIAAMREKAAAEAAAAAAAAVSVSVSVSVSSSAVQGAEAEGRGRGGEKRRAQRRKRGRAEEQEQEADVEEDAAPKPAKRTRRRAARK